MEKIMYYAVPADKIGLVLSYMNPNGWMMDAAGQAPQPISKHYGDATSRDWDGHQPIFKLEEWKDYRFVSITTDLIMKNNNQFYPIHEYSKLKLRLGIPGTTSFNHLTKENLERETKTISDSIQSVVFDSKEKLSTEEHAKVFNFLCGTNYGVFLLSKYIERGRSQPYREFVKEELRRLKITESVIKI